MLKAKSRLVLPFLLFTLIVQAQKATITGKILDAESQDLLFGATIQSASAGTTSNMTDGTYSLSLPSGKQLVTASYIGYESQTLEIDLKDGEVREVVFKLKEEATLLDIATVTGSKFEKPLGELTVTLNVIQPQLLENTNATAVDEVIGKLPGVDVSDGQANIRGGSGWSYGAGSRVLLLVDDLPALQGDAGFPNWRDLPVENIDQIEVLKGAASALYGSSAMNGIINVRTAYAKLKPITKVSMYNTIYFAPKDTNLVWWEKANPFEAGTQFAHRQKFGRFSLTLGGNVFYNNSFRQGEFDRKGRLTANTKYQVNDQLSFGVNVNYNSGSGADFFLWDSDVNNYVPKSGTLTKSVITRYNIDPNVTYFDNSGNRHKLLTRIYRVENNNGNNQSNFSTLSYGEYQFQKKFEPLDLTMVAGVLGHSTASKAELYGDASYNISNLAAYLQLDKKFFDKLSLSLGFRYENNTISSPDSLTTITFTGNKRILNPEPNTNEGRPVFRFGANYQAAKYTYIRASWGQGYRFPTIAERYIATNVSVIGIRPNPTLQSETGWSAEIGLKQGLQISNWKGFFDLSLFWSEYQNMMEFTFVSDLELGFFGFNSANVGDTRIRGVETSIIGQGRILGAPTNVILGYTYIDPQFQTFDSLTQARSSVDYNILKYRRKHAFKLDIQSTFFKKLSVGVSTQYNSRMEAVDAFFESIPGLGDLFGIGKYRDENEGSYLLVDARVAWNISKQAKLSLVFKNITNEEYTIRPALLAAPANATLRLDYEF